MTTTSHHSGHQPDQPAPLKPQTPRIWIVRWVVANSCGTKHHVYLTRSYAQRFHDLLLADGRDVAMFTTAVDWQEVNQ